MSFFSTLGYGIKSAYNYMRPMKTSDANFIDALESASMAVEEIKDAVANTVANAKNTVILAGTGYIAVNTFKSIVSNIFLAKAVNNLVWFATPTITTKAIDATFDILVKYPSQVFTSTIGGAYAIQHSRVIDFISKAGSATTNAVKAGYHTVKSALEFSKAGVALGYEIGDILTGNMLNNVLDNVEISKLIDSTIVGDLEYQDAIS